MKSLLSPTLISAVASAVAADRVVTPSSISFDALGRVGDGDSTVVNALTTEGLVSLRDIPGFRQTKLRLMSNLHSCMMDLGDDVTTFHFDDGTTRRSFATSTVPGVGAQPIKSLEDIPMSSNSDSCRSFQGEVSSFRSMVEMATKLFAHKLSADMQGYLQTPLMSSNVDGVIYNSIDEVVAGGEHLEHFHSYQKDNSSEDAEVTTIEMHMDQGFFIAFTPGLIVSQDASKLNLSDGFYVQDRFGEKATVKFSEEDDLVFMIGDGANQYINTNLADSKDALPLRATPHALSFPSQVDSSYARVWYGRMVLPPNNALLDDMDLTHGEVRETLMGGRNTAGSSLSLGCSSQDMKAVIHTSRYLSGPSEILNCTSDELFCWYRCQPLDDELKTCAERDLTLECVDSQGQKSDPAQHNGAAPACYNTTAQIAEIFLGVDWQGDDHGDDDHSHGDDGHSHGDDDHSHGDDGHSHDDLMDTKTSAGPRSKESFFAWSLIAAFTILKYW